MTVRLVQLEGHRTRFLRFGTLSRKSFRLELSGVSFESEVEVDLPVFIFAFVGSRL